MSDPDTLPFSQASENNKQPINEVLQRHLGNITDVLEIGGGTGQHATFFAEQFPRLIWQSTDVPANVATLNLRIKHAALPNLPDATALDVDALPWPVNNFNAIYTANTLHIMAAESVVNFFQGVGSYLNANGLLLVYGPFKYAGEFTTESNARFDVWLKNQNPVSGIRDFERVDALAEDAGLRLLEDNSMLANNQLLVWKKVP